MSKPCDKCKTENLYSIHGRCLSCGHQQFPSKKYNKKEEINVDKKESDGVERVEQS
jgi:uncharacterized OB-fold protein